MQFLLDGKNKILAYGGEIYEASCDINISKDDKILLDDYFFVNECFLKDGKVIIADPLDLTISEDDMLKQKREERETLLTAFDKWEKAVLRGRAKDSTIIMNWFYDLLDLKDEAFVEIPKEILYYLPKPLVEEHVE